MKGRTIFLEHRYLPWRSTSFGKGDRKESSSSTLLSPPMRYPSNEGPGFSLFFPATKRQLSTYLSLDRTEEITFFPYLRPNLCHDGRDLIVDVLRTLWSHKLRAFLTMFGIAWGIVSIVLMVAAGEGLRKGQEEQARNLGKDVMIVFHGRTSLQAAARTPGGPCTGKTRTFQWYRRNLRTANMRFRNLSRIPFEYTAISTMQH